MIFAGSNRAVRHPPNGRATAGFAALALLATACTTTATSGAVSTPRRLDDFLALSAHHRRHPAWYAATRLDPVRDWPLSLQVERAESSPHERGLFLPDVHHLTLAEAAELARFDGGRIFLPDLSGIDADVARTLAGAGAELFLDGVASLDIAAANALADAGLPRLSLRGLLDLTPAVAHALARTRGSLRIGGMERLDLDTARALATWRGWGEHVVLTLGVTSLEPEVATALAACRGWGVAFDRLARLDAESAAALARLDTPYLALNGLDSIDDELAEVVGSWQRKFLALDGVTSISTAGKQRIEAGNHVVTWRSLGATRHRQDG